MLDPSHVVTGVLHAAVAFDWGDEVDLEHARRLAPAEFRTLARRLHSQQHLPCGGLRRFDFDDS